ncbi:MAG: VCBS repeat-containing protein, partial [Bacteroidota bacterium]|nr:VCBS repeat-containing protein [Bacteroidota bacterium]
PDNTYQPITISKDTSSVLLSYQKHLPKFDFNRITSFKKAGGFVVENITDKTGLNFLHTENVYSEFDREPLIPHMFSTEGPALAVADINNDGMEDVFIGSSKGGHSGIFLQTAGGRFSKLDAPALNRDSMFENVAATWADVNNDGYKDLVVAGGGNEYQGADAYLAPRIYMNDGKMHFSIMNNAFNQLYVNASTVVAGDFDGDGYIDLFIGGRTVPGKYGEVPQSYLLQNDRSGHFKDVTATRAADLKTIGFVTNSVLVDIDKDGDQDIVVSLEWGGIVAFINNKGTFTKRVLTDRNGWWNFVTPCDIDNDGDIDLIAGNLGLNSRLKASMKEPVKLYYNDFDGNGKSEQLLTYFVNGKEIPFASKAELEKQIPVLKKKFLYAKDFARASLEDMFSTEKLLESKRFSADYFANSILINDGKMNFTLKPLPWQAQLSSYRDAVVVNANDDNLPDILLGGNYYENNIEMGRYDADIGTILINKGRGVFASEDLNGFTVKGQVRHINKIEIGRKEAYILARNNDSTVVIQFTGKNKNY